MAGIGPITVSYSIPVVILRGCEMRSKSCICGMMNLAIILLEVCFLVETEIFPNGGFQFQ